MIMSIKKSVEIVVVKLIMCNIMSNKKYQIEKDGVYYGYNDKKGNFIPLKYMRKKDLSRYLLMCFYGGSR